MGNLSYLLLLDRLRPVIAVALAGAPVYFLFLLYYYGAPSVTRVGYQPEQPVAFSHRLHAGELGLDCRYCHNTVDQAAYAAVPPSDTCMNCHTLIRKDSPQLATLFRRHREDLPMGWIRVHNVPDYVYFNHSAHVRRGVSCVECHGRIDQMEVVGQQTPLSMSWCLECHRNPAPRLRPPEHVYDLDWVSTDESPEEIGRRIQKEYNINPSTSCSTCHR